MKNQKSEQPGIKTEDTEKQRCKYRFGAAVNHCLLVSTSGHELPGDVGFF